MNTDVRGYHSVPGSIPRNQQCFLPSALNGRDSLAQGEALGHKVIHDDAPPLRGMARNKKPTGAQSRHASKSYRRIAAEAIVDRKHEQN